MARRKLWVEKNREKIKKERDSYYANNREEIAKKKKIKNQKTSYEYDRVESTRKKAIIRDKTRKMFPLKGQVCVKCGSDAEHRHHTTDPIEWDKFDFLCEKCHNIIHGRRNFNNSASYTRRSS